MAIFIHFLTIILSPIRKFGVTLSTYIQISHAICFLVMKKSIIIIFLTYILLVAVFAIQKPLFMLFHFETYSNAQISQFLEVIYHGLPLDLSMAGYLTIIPGLITIISHWCKSPVILNRLLKFYFIIISAVISMTTCLDLALYGYWGFRLDMTPIFYFSTSPSAALASVPTYYFVIGILGVIGLTICLAWLLNHFITSNLFCIVQSKPTKIRNSAILSLIVASLFIPIRGGFTVATMNLSAVYFSQQQEFNHAAINPLFSLMYSATHQNNFSSQFRYFDTEEADSIYKELTKTSNCDSITHIINNTRPDIYIIILESFSSHLLNSKCDSQPITPQLDSIASQSILFTNIYASGIRTDRGIPAILSGYPAQPNTSIMKYVDKTDKLPSIARSLKNAGWETSYYYGGDANFTNMHAYLVSSGFSNIISDKDFPIGDRLSKWGAHDHLVFERCLADISSCESSTPHFKVIQTSSSHEPFDVPYKRLSNNRANAFAYTDNCVGAFIDSLKRLNKWNNSLIILIPDHYGAYPQKLDNQIERHRIPLIFTGGAISHPMQINTIGSQTDLASTLLSQLGIEHKEYTFSKDILNSAESHFAFISAPSLFGFIDDNGYIIYNYDSDNIIDSNGNKIDSTLLKGKAFIQKLYNDLDNR